MSAHTTATARTPAPLPPNTSTVAAGLVGATIALTWADMRDLRLGSAALDLLALILFTLLLIGANAENGDTMPRTPEQIHAATQKDRDQWRLAASFLAGYIRGMKLMPIDTETARVLDTVDELGDVVQLKHGRRTGRRATEHQQTPA